MATNSGIQWTTHTFNPWRGCTKISPGCLHCYADTLSKRNPKALGVWGPNGTRAPASESYWREPAKWEKAARAAGERHRVFCASLADVFEGPETMPEAGVPVVTAGRKRLFDTIWQTPSLDWLLLTKRPQNLMAMLPHDFVGRDRHGPEAAVPWSNVWLGTSVEDATRTSRIEHLRETPAAVRFLSMEPLIEHPGKLDLSGIHWVIVGAESGSGRRSMPHQWARDILAQCRAQGVAFFNKQMDVISETTGDIDRFPADLRVREFPAVAGRGVAKRRRSPSRTRRASTRCTRPSGAGASRLLPSAATRR